MYQFIKEKYLERQLKLAEEAQTKKSLQKTNSNEEMTGLDWDGINQKGGKIVDDDASDIDDDIHFPK